MVYKEKVETYMLAAEHSVNLLFSEQRPKKVERFKQKSKAIPI